MKRKVIALLQARTDSTRLPKKVLKTLLGKPMIIQELIRVDKSTLIDKLILLTSVEASDDELAKIVSDFGFAVFRGSKDNVLERFYACAEELNLNDQDIIVRLTGDCPLHDAKIIDELINAFIASDLEYMANSVAPVYPDGLDAEVLTYKALKEAYLKAEKLSDKEHVTPYIRDSGLFKVGNLEIKPVYPEWRLTVDEPSDFVVVEKIYNHFKSNEFSFLDVVSFLETNPKIIEINRTINRNEGYLKSLEEDNV